MYSKIDHVQAATRGGAGWLVPHRDAYLGELDKLGYAARTISRHLAAVTATVVSAGTQSSESSASTSPWHPRDVLRSGART